MRASEGLVKTEVHAVKRPERHRPRRGAAMVELALCLPLFFLITMATVETCRMLYVRQSTKIAAYECARLGIIPGIEKQSLIDQCDLILQGRGIRGYQFSFSPEDLTTLHYGDLFSVTIQTAADQNDLVGGWFFQGKMFTETVTIMAEY